MQRQQHLPDRLVADRRRHRDTGGRGGLQIAADGLRIEPELGGDSLLRQAGGAARKLDQSAVRKVIHRKDVHSTPFALSGLFLVRGQGV
jgi:hypothetical protein